MFSARMLVEPDGRVMSAAQATESERVVLTVAAPCSRREGDRIRLVLLGVCTTLVVLPQTERCGWFTASTPGAQTAHQTRAPPSWSSATSLTRCRLAWPSSRCSSRTFSLLRQDLPVTSEKRLSRSARGPPATVASGPEPRAAVPELLVDGVAPLLRLLPHPNPFPVHRPVHLPRRLVVRHLRAAPLYPLSNDAQPTIPGMRPVGALYAMSPVSSIALAAVVGLSVFIPLFSLRELAQPCGARHAQLLARPIPA